jgi:hypothetical protein
LHTRQQTQVTPKVMGVVETTEEIGSVPSTLHRDTDRVPIFGTTVAKASSAHQ